MACTYLFDDGTAKGKKIRVTGQGKTELIAKEKLRKNIEKKQEKILFGTALAKGEVTVKRALMEFLEKEKSGQYISKKTDKSKTPITVEHDIETANALLFPCKELMGLQVNKVNPAHISKWKTCRRF